MVVFPTLFESAVLKRGSVAAHGVWELDSWNWNLEWGDFLFAGDSEDASLLLDAIHEFVLDRGSADSWQWR